MEFFKKYSSNTFAGSGNQMVYNTNKNTVHTGRVFYKIAHSGQYNYSILFSNIIDSTFYNGKESHKNLICNSWDIINAKIGKCPSADFPENFTENTSAETINRSVTEFKDITFQGKLTKNVAPAEFFCCDPVLLDFKGGDYLCLEITFSGTMIPYHEETLLPVYKKTADGWVYSKGVPFAGMIGCDRKVKQKIGYIGDSITQGIGTPSNSYTHWNAVLSEKLGSDYAYWNLGLGFGRANDMASGGAWMYKALQNDILVVCYGVNDILQGFSAEQITQDLETIVDLLLKADKKVILQTVPPFDYNEENTAKWNIVNEFIRGTLSKKVNLVFDVVPVLGKSPEEPHIAPYGGHPNAEGCTIWANALYEKIKESHILD